VDFTALEVVGTTQTNHVQGRGSAPSVTVNTAYAGTGATATVSGTDLGFEVTLNTGSGTGTGGGRLFTINYNTTQPCTTIPVFSAGDDSGLFAVRNAAAPCYIANADASDFEFWSTGQFTASTTYKINFFITAKP